MKKLMASFLFVAAAALAGFAQGKPDSARVKDHPKKSPAQRADKVADKMQKQLMLNDDQKSKVHDLALTRAQRMDDLHAQYNGQNKQVLAPQHKQIESDFRSGLKSVLTYDQYVAWQKIEMQKHRRHMKQHGHRPPGPPSPPDHNPPPPPGDDGK